MTPFRDIKRKARRDLHSIMQVAACYYATPGGAMLPVTIRDHTKAPIQNGGLPGGSAAAQYATVAEVEPRIIFLVAEVPRPRVGAIVSVEAGEAYRVAMVEPSDDITITAKVTRIPVGDPALAGLAVPA